MIVNCHINKKLEWQCLPWQQINRRIVIMQRKILEASKEYNLKLVYKVQNTLINSFEARLFAINKIIHDTNKYYNYENYSFKDIEKFYIFKYLFSYSIPLKAKLKMLIEQIKEYLIYLCLEPEWKSRLNSSNIKYLKNDNIHNTKEINWKKLIYKNQYLPYIYNSINYWIINKFFINNNNYRFKYLKDLLISISNLKFHWYNIKLIKSYNIYLYCKNSYLKTESSLIILNDSLANIFINIKSKFYYKNHFNKLKFNKQLIWPTIINIINSILQSELCRNIKRLKYSCIKYVINQINNLLSSLKINQKHKHFIYLLHNDRFNLYRLLYKKIISIYLYKYLFKINR